MGTDYVQRRDGNVYVGDTRVTLDSIIQSWRAGGTPEEVHEDFPTVPLAYVYGAIAYALEHHAEVGEYLRENDELWRKGRAQAEAAHPVFYAMMRQRFGEARKRLDMGSAQDTDSSAETPLETPAS